MPSTPSSSSSSTGTSSSSAPVPARFLPVFVFPFFLFLFFNFFPWVGRTQLQAFHCDRWAQCAAYCWRSLQGDFLNRCTACFVLCNVPVISCCSELLALDEGRDELLFVSRGCRLVRCSCATRLCPSLPPSSTASRFVPSAAPVNETPSSSSTSTGTSSNSAPGTGSRRLVSAAAAPTGAWLRP